MWINEAQVSLLSASPFHRQVAFIDLSAVAVSARTQSHTGAQEFLRVDCFAVDPGFVVQMRTSRSAG
jgi:hypothetical protein